jgi:hypothetical protein
LFEGVGLFDVVEFETDVDVLVVVFGLMDRLRAHSSARTCLLEPRESSEPSTEIRDWVFDLQCRHDVLASGMPTTGEPNSAESAGEVGTARSHHNDRFPLIEDRQLSQVMARLGHASRTLGFGRD